MKSLPESRPQRPHRKRLHRPHQTGTKPPELVRQEISAGGIIYRVRNGIVEIFFIKDPFGRWTFPKGHTEPGEEFFKTAIRESYEEAGLTGLELVAPLGRTAFRFRRQGTVIQKTVHFFLFEAPSNATEHFASRENLQEEGREPIFEGKWVRPADVFFTSSYKNSDRLLANALREISFRRRRGQRKGRV